MRWRTTDRGWPARSSYVPSARQDQTFEGLSPCNGRRRWGGLKRRAGEGVVSGNTGRLVLAGLPCVQKKCPREAGSFGVGAYAQTCCASLQGGRQRSRIRKCAIGKNSEWQRPVVPASRRRPDSSGEPVAGVDFLSGDISRSIGRILPPGVVARKRQRRVAVRRCRDTGGPASLCFSVFVSLIARADACVRCPQGVDVRQRKAKAAAQPWRNL